MYIYVCACVQLLLTRKIHTYKNACSSAVYHGGHRRHERILAGAGSVADWGPFGGQARRAGGLSSAQWLEGPVEWVENVENSPELDGFNDFFLMVYSL